MCLDVKLIILQNRVLFYLIIFSLTNLRNKCFFPLNSVSRVRFASVLLVNLFVYIYNTWILCFLYSQKKKKKISCGSFILKTAIRINLYALLIYCIFYRDSTDNKRKSNSKLKNGIKSNVTAVIENNCEQKRGKKRKPKVKETVNYYNHHIF